VVLYTDEDAEEGSCRGAEEQILQALQQAEGGEKAAEICRKLGSANRPFAPRNESIPLWG